MDAVADGANAAARKMHNVARFNEVGTSRSKQILRAFRSAVNRTHGLYLRGSAKLPVDLTEASSSAVRSMRSLPLAVSVGKFEVRIFGSPNNSPPFD